jgi:hypothetical protein
MAAANTGCPRGLGDHRCGHEPATHEEDALNRTLIAVPAVLLGLVLAGSARAQGSQVTPTAPDYPRGKISGYMFGDYYWNAAGDPSHHYNAAGADSGQVNIDGNGKTVITKDLNGLQFRRLYLQLDNDLSARYSTRVRLEADGKSLTSDGKIGINVKALYVQAKSVLPRMDVYAGLVSVPFFDVTEEFWAYRSIEKVLPDFRGFSPSADLGVQAKGFFDTNHVLGYNVLLGNGNGQKTETNRQKRVSGSLPVRWKDLHFEPYIDYENFFGGQDRLSWQVMLGYDLPKHGAVGYVVTDQIRHAPVGPYKEFLGHSLFARVQPNPKLGGFARFDLFLNDKRAANRVDQQLWIAGLDWQPFGDVHVMPNVEAMQYTGKGTGAASVAPVHNETQARITFYWRFSKPQS